MFPLALRYRLMVGNAYTKRLFSPPGATRGKALFPCLNRRGKSCSIKSCLVAQNTHTSRTDPSQTPAVARPSVVQTASELSMEKTFSTFTRTPLLFLPPQNQLLFPTPCFIWEYCSADTRSVYLNLTASINKVSGKLAGNIKLG